jgi:hypothetical protein
LPFGIVRSCGMSVCSGICELVRLFQSGREVMHALGGIPYGY